MKKIYKTTIQKGSKVSLQSLSGGIAGDVLFKHKYLIGKDRVGTIGLDPIDSPNSLKGAKFISENPKARAEDLNEAFADKETKLVIANIGGFDSHTIIPYLDLDIIKNNPKPILGFSDITSLHLFLLTQGIQTYYGPTTLAGFAENVNMHGLTKKSVESVLFTNDSQVINSSIEWTSEFLDWANEDFDNQSRKMNKEKHGHEWNKFTSNISGRLIGGCLDTIIRIKDKKFFPDISYWENKVIFLETSENHMSPDKFRDAIILLKEEIEVSKAVIFGKPQDEKYYDEYKEVLKELMNKPYITNVNIGHAAPIYTIPLDGTIKLNPETKTIIISK